ncbi:MAG: hypothetical protein KAG64_05420 [Bacteroidales bacterium]|nr:hypothetical protein [Bacteroidales bacterium]
MKKTLLSFLLIALLSIGNTFAQKKKAKQEKDKYYVNSGMLSTLKFREIGPAMISGRISDLAVNPNNHSEYYVAVASGGVFKTTNSGVTFKPIFDKQGSYSIGCISIDPNNSNVVWVGTGENNSQRSVSWGDGIYKSLDGGKSWKNMGLKESEHIGKIIIDPNNSNIVYVAAQGPLWGAGGDRGLYKTTDGGQNWELILEISENTGVSDIAIDPRNTAVLYATSYQRRRHVYTLINGGPESTIYKSEDAGKTWRKIEKGLPGGDKGRIGIALSPANPDYLYAIVEAAEGKGGTYRSTDRGESWTKMNSYVSGSPQYYQELIPDPKDPNCFYSMDTYARYTLDGGKSFTKFSYKSKHVDDHALWIDPNNTQHLLNGSDGGLYESYDRGKTWDYKANLPLSQFYRVAVDNDLPFYNVYGGTQDNNSVGGPSRTIKKHGIVNTDWYITNGGDGFESQIDPTDPNTVYAQAQYGWIVRYNRATGEKIGIKPVEPDNGEAYRWNWDAPLLISPHNPKRLFFAANKLFKSDDRGNSWEVISPDLTRQLNRNELKVMGIIQSPEAVAKNASTSIYGNIVAFDESPKKEGLLYVGTDDGLIQISEDMGKSWKKQTSVAGVPETTYVSCLKASLHDENVVYASFENHKNNDFKPYILKSTNKGGSWTSIAGNLPDDEVVWNIAEDHENPDLLFVGTEHGLFFTIDNGVHWTKLSAGLPNIAIRDIDIQRRENDLVLASYGRGFYVLDDYSALRDLKKVEDKEDYIFPIRPSLMYNESSPFGWRKKGHFGDNFYTANNPPVGAVFTYYIAEGMKTPKQIRKKEEAKKIKANEEISYPTFDYFAKEDKALNPYILFTIRDEQGNVVRKLKASASAGMKRIVWDFRYPATAAIRSGGRKNNFANEGGGLPVVPGNYTVEMAKVLGNEITSIGNKQTFVCRSLYNQRLASDPATQKLKLEMQELNRVFSGITQEFGQLNKQLKLVALAIKSTPNSTSEMMKSALAIQVQLDSINVLLYGDKVRSKRNAASAPGLQSRLGNAIYNSWGTHEPPTQTQIDDFEIVQSHMGQVQMDLKSIKEDLKDLDGALDKIKAAYTPGR